MFRLTKALRKNVSVDAVVVGGGPSGIAVVGSLLQGMPGRRQHQRNRQLWVDPHFSAGRVNALYREVPSNTKVELFSKFATSTEPFRLIVDEASRPNAFTALQELPQDQGCELGRAADMCLMLSSGLARRFPDNLRRHRGKVTAASLDRSTNLWSVSLDNADTATTPRLVLCTGSSPIEQPLPPGLGKDGIPTRLHLDTILTPSILAKTLDASHPATVAVVGASHSAILVLMNLYMLASTTHPLLRVKWFTRHKDLRYAQYMDDGWILYDNTGLKGRAAQWARENLDDAAFSSSPARRVITKLWTPSQVEQDVYRAEMPDCSHVVQAIGYQRDPLPELTTADGPLTIRHDGLTGRFFFAADSVGQRTYIPGLFGAGIAFPEQVTDPAGNVEHAVGFWKFINFCKRVVPQWIESPKWPDENASLNHDERQML